MPTHVHIAIFRWKEDASIQDIEAALLVIEALARKVPGVIEIAVGENGSRFGEGYSHVVLVRAESAAALDAYRKHPDHVQAAIVIEAAESHGIGVDFVTGEFSDKLTAG